MHGLVLSVPDDVEALAEHVAELVLKRLPSADSVSPWLTVAEAAEYLRTTPDGIRSAEKRGQLVGHRPADTRRLLFRREELDGYAQGQAPSGRAA
jgi:excisionase family DNA binding protein